MRIPPNALAAIATMWAAIVPAAAPAQPRPPAPSTPAPAPASVVPGPVAHADAALARIDSVAAGVRRQLQLARAQRDAVRALCLNDKLNQADAVGRAAREQRAALAAALGRADGEAAARETAALGMSRQRADAIGAEAAACVGGPVGPAPDRTTVRVLVDPNLPGQDAASYPDFPILGAPPTCASCFR